MRRRVTVLFLCVCVCVCLCVCLSVTTLAETLLISALKMRYVHVGVYVGAFLSLEIVDFR